MANDFNCKKCGSPDTKTFKMLYEQGASTGTFGGISTGVGVGVGSGGLGVGVNTTGFSGSMSNTTLLAERIQPPQMKKKPDGSPLSAPLLIITVVCWMYVFAVSNGVPAHRGQTSGATIVALIATVLWIVLTVRDIIKKTKDAEHYNTKIYPDAYKKWQQMHMCMRCGHEYQSEPFLNN